MLGELVFPLLRKLTEIVCEVFESGNLLVKKPIFFEWALEVVDCCM